MRFWGFFRLCRVQIKISPQAFPYPCPNGSRTLDIGKACRPLFPHHLTLKAVVWGNFGGKNMVGLFRELMCRVGDMGVGRGGIILKGTAGIFGCPFQN